MAGQSFTAKPAVHAPRGEGPVRAQLAHWKQHLLRYHSAIGFKVSVRMAVIEEQFLPAEIEDRWLALTLRSAEPFSEASVNFLIEHIPDRAFVLVATIGWRGSPLSLCFRLQRTVTAEGLRVRERLSRFPRTEPGRWINRPIDLHPLTDSPVIALRGERACGHVEALKRAEHLWRYTGSLALYRIDRSGTGTA